MYHPKPDFPPLFPKVGWWRRYTASILNGETPQEAIRKANASVKPREWMRFDGLSLPIEGGASALKNRLPATWRLSEKAVAEGRKMDATLATRYGGTPFYRLLDHLISLRDTIQGKEMASEVCIEAFRRVEGILGLDRIDLLESARDFKPPIPDWIDNEEEILALLFRKGLEAIFQLLPTFNVNGSILSDI